MILQKQTKELMTLLYPTFTATTPTCPSTPQILTFQE